MFLPVHFLKFYFLDSFIIFARIWHNSLMVLEEDLAVGLMFKLLFTPLFHDTTFIGKVISFLFRVSRIIYGLLAYFLATLVILLLAVFWYLNPLLLFLTTLVNPDLSPLSQLEPIFVILLLIQLSLFLHQLYQSPLKKVWQIKTSSDFWKATKLKKEQITWNFLYETSEVQSILQSLELTGKNFSPQNIGLSDELLQKTLLLAKTNKARFLTAGYFWLAMLSSIPVVENSLLEFNLSLEDFYAALMLVEKKRQSWRKVFLWDDDFAVKHLKGVNRGWLGAPTPALDSASKDLTREAARYGFEDFVGRKAAVSEVVEILSQEKDRNVLLVGPAGSGKTTLVNYLAKQIVLGDAPRALATKRLVSLEISRLLSGVKTEGDLAQKIKDIFEEVQFIENIIIYVDEIHNLGIGEAGANFNLYSLMLPFLESDRFQFLGSTEVENFARILEKNSSFVRLFHKVELPPASKEETMEVIFERAVELARDKKINLTSLAIKTLVEMAAKLNHDRVLPDSALSILEECEVEAKDGLITSAIVKQVFSKTINVPVLELDSSQKELLLNLENVIHERMIDQEEAVKKVADTLRRSAASLRESNRPIGSFLFVGPTGVGKTELAKILSETYFKGNGAFIRFDMSEYQTPQASERLIGNFNNPGELTQAVKNKPYCLLLLDEFEKAEPKILNLFLQVLDDGRLTDASGKTVDFTSTIIIATSNIASLIIAEGLQKGLALNELNGGVKSELLKVLKPELLNRFDETVIFKPLSREDLQKVVKIKLEAVTKLLKDQGYLIEFSPQLVSELAKRGFDPVLGARPLRRVIQDTLEAKLSRMILLNELKRGETFQAGIELLT